MKKNGIVVTSALFFLLLLSAAGYADAGDQRRDGEVQMKEAPMLIEKGKMMQECKYDDKAAMVKEGNVMMTEGHRMVEIGMRMRSTKGHFNLQEMGLMLSNAGKLLIEKGEQKEPLTEEDRKMLKKKGENLEGLGNLKLNEGKTM